MFGNVTKLTQIVSHLALNCFKVKRTNTKYSYKNRYRLKSDFGYNRLTQISLFAFEPFNKKLVCAHYSSRTNT